MQAAGDREDQAVADLDRTGGLVEPHLLAGAREAHLALVDQPRAASRAGRLPQKRARHNPDIRPHRLLSHGGGAAGGDGPRWIPSDLGACG